MAPLVLVLVVLGVAASACGGSSSAGDGGQSQRDAAAACTGRTPLSEGRTGIEIVNSTSETIVIQVLASSCEGFAESGDPSMLNGREVAAGGTLKEVLVRNYARSAPYPLQQMQLSFRTRSANGRGSQIITFAPDNVLTARWGVIPDITWDIEGFQVRVGAVSEPQSSGTARFDRGDGWNGSWNGSVNAYLTDGRPVQILWSGGQNLTFTIKPR